VPEDEMNLSVITYQLRTLHNDVVDMKTVLSDLTKAITKLALVEERQTTLHQAQERTFTAIRSMENRVTQIETKMPEYTRAGIWVDRVTWGVLGLFSMHVAKSLGLFS